MKIVVPTLFIFFLAVVTLTFISVGLDFWPALAVGFGIMCVCCALSGAMIAFVTWGINFDKRRNLARTRKS